MAHARQEQAFAFPTHGGSGAETSPPAPVKGLKNVGVQIDGTFVATVAIMGRLSSSLNFFTLTSVTAPGFYPIPNDVPLADLQVVISGYTSGQVEALYAGRLAQF